MSPLTPDIVGRGKNKFSVSSNSLLFTPVIRILDDTTSLGTLELKENTDPVIFELETLVPETISPNSFLKEAFSPEKKLPLKESSSPNAP